MIGGAQVGVNNRLVNLFMGIVNRKKNTRVNNNNNTQN